MKKIRYVMGIVGGRRPSSYSKSPALWKQWCELVSFPGRFDAYDVSGAELKRFLRSVWDRTDFPELTVTDPYKRRACELFHSFASAQEAPYPSAGKHASALVVSAAVRRLGTMNHLIRGRDGTQAYLENTDGKGLVEQLPPEIWAGSRILIVGAGGAAASIAHALPQSIATLKITNLYGEQAEALARLVRSVRPELSISTFAFELLSEPSVHELLDSVDVVVAAVSGGDFLSTDLLKPHAPRLSIIDTRYGAAAKTFLAGRAAGADSYDGSHMLFGQFALAVTSLAELHDIPRRRHERALGTIRSRFLSGHASP